MPTQLARMDSSNKTMLIEETVLTKKTTLTTSATIPVASKIAPRVLAIIFVIFETSFPVAFLRSSRHPKRW